MNLRIFGNIRKASEIMSDVRFGGTGLTSLFKPPPFSLPKDFVARRNLVHLNIYPFKSILMEFQTLSNIIKVIFRAGSEISVKRGGTTTLFRLTTEMRLEVLTGFSGFE